MILLSKLLAWKFLVETMHTRLTSVKRFANLKVNLTVEQVQTCNLFLHISYEFEYFYQCITTFSGLKDSKGPILMPLTLRRGLWTFLVNLALCGAWCPPDNAMPSNFLSPKSWDQELFSDVLSVSVTAMVLSEYSHLQKSHSNGSNKSHGQFLQKSCTLDV